MTKEAAKMAFLVGRGLERFWENDSGWVRL